MKKFWFNILIVAGIVFVLDFAIGKTLRHFYFKEISGFQYSATYAIDSTKADIVIFGGSRAKYHYIPSIIADSLKMSFYNTGSEGNAVFFQLAVLKSVLKRHVPKIIILDFKESLDEGEDGYDKITLLFPYYKTHQEMRDIIRLKSPYEAIKQVSQIYPFNSEILTIIMDNMEINKKRNPDDRGTYTKLGQWPYNLDVVKDTFSYKADSAKVNALHEFISLANKSGAKVFVIYSPIFVKYVRQEQETTICKSICASENVPFWDFSQDTVFLNNGHLFFDTYHLNQKGSDIFSQMFAHKLKRYVDSLAASDGNAKQVNAITGNTSKL